MIVIYLSTVCCVFHYFSLRINEFLLVLSVFRGLEWIILIYILQQIIIILDWLLFLTVLWESLGHWSNINRRVWWYSHLIFWSDQNLFNNFQSIDIIITWSIPMSPKVRSKLAGFVMCGHTYTLLLCVYLKYNFVKIALCISLL